jgi:hypothetical protein
LDGAPGELAGDGQFVDEGERRNMLQTFLFGFTGSRIHRAKYPHFEIDTGVDHTAGPSVGSCNGAPSGPVFATNARDLARFRSRQACLKSKTLGGTDNCALCYNSDSVFSSVPPDTETYPVNFTVRGSGTMKLRLKGAILQEKVLSDETSTTIELTNAEEGDTFVFEVSPAEGVSGVPNIYGYLHSLNPKDGIWTMPLNLLVTVDDDSGTVPSKSGGFFEFTDIGLTVAKMRPASGKTTMRLRGVIPFTFVQPSEFSAMDCLENPYQKRASSANAPARNCGIDRRCSDCTYWLRPPSATVRTRIVFQGR